MTYFQGQLGRGNGVSSNIVGLLVEMCVLAIYRMVKVTDKYRMVKVTDKYRMGKVTDKYRMVKVTDKY